MLHGAEAFVVSTWPVPPPACARSRWHTLIRAWLRRVCGMVVVVVRGGGGALVGSRATAIVVCSSGCSCHTCRQSEWCCGCLPFMWQAPTARAGIVLILLHAGRLGAARRQCLAAAPQPRHPATPLPTPHLPIKRKRLPLNLDLASYPPIPTPSRDYLAADCQPVNHVAAKSRL